MPHIIVGTGNIANEFKLFEGKEQKIAKFGVAVEDMSRVIFFNCTAFSRNFAEKSWELLVGLKKGHSLYFEGKFSDSKYTNKKGEEVKSRDLIISRFELPRDRKNSESSEDASVSSTPPASSEKSSKLVDDGDIPF